MPDKSISTNQAGSVGNSPEADPQKSAPSRRQIRVNELLAERDQSLPVWIRSPKSGPEFYSGFSRSKLYELADRRKIRSVSIREPGAVKGTRLFLLASILAFIETCETEAHAEGAK
jgi:hypothetical protein